MNCSCGVFEVTDLPCMHAMTVACYRNLVPYDFCSRYYSIESWLNAYAETCYLVCDEDDWDIPEIIKQRVCLKPPVKVKKQRTITKRRSSQVEVRKVRRRCTSCGGQGHNMEAFKTMMPTPSTSKESSS
ncbi:uncharacterized protein LOC124930164 [Impatiens glandulifera]|uniref:uncharacterized protein LOC124930164 n=1 Tax=Impatiens glandulifera TaxID=253017 RepID=UPI001FB0F5BB|nr:uncharacterized protein LOC124930164 [Impatiens glandulifera]